MSYYTSMVFCGHANGHPSGACQCPQRCGCREFMCKMEDHGIELDLTNAPRFDQTGITKFSTKEQKQPVLANPKFHAVLQKMAAMHEKKNHDYAHKGNPYSNFEEAAAFAGTTVDTVFRVMLGIKVARLNELIGTGKTPNNESVNDTRLDLAVYAALYVSYFDA